MMLDEFEAEAQRLARAGVALSESEAGSPMGYWHGVRPGELCISVLRDGIWLNVYLDEEEGGEVQQSAQPSISAVPLYGQTQNYLPPVDGVFLRGSAAIAEYLATHDWSRDDPFNDNFPHPTPGEYERLWQENCPMYQSGIVAVLGGWHFPWPEGDWPTLVDHELVVFTLRDSEPWVEVFSSGDSFLVKQRIS